MSIQKWKELTNAIWVISKPWKWWWTYAHIDIALDFASYLSPPFKLYLFKDYQKLKKLEQERLNSNWDHKRSLSKVNYGFMTDAIRDNLIPDKIAQNKIWFIYAEEADLINLALFNQTAKQRKDKNKQQVQDWYNMREFATPEQLVVLSNLEYKNSDLIKEWLSQQKRLEMLNDIAIEQMNKLTKAKHNVKKITAKNKPQYLN